MLDDAENVGGIKGNWERKLVSIEYGVCFLTHMMSLPNLFVLTEKVMLAFPFFLFY